MERTVTDQVKVEPRKIGLLNKYLNKVKRVAVHAIDPVYGVVDGQVIEAFKLSLEGPPKHLSYFHRLLDDANLKIS